MSKEFIPYETLKEKAESILPKEERQKLVEKYVNAKLKDKALDTDCVLKKAYISTNEYGEEDNRRYCYGLFDNFKDEVSEKCKICEAYINNAVLLKKVDNIDYTEALERFNRMFDLEEASDDYIIITQALIQAKKDKIIADFIREHYKLSDDINKNYLELKKPITEEEHNKFKENL